MALRARIGSARRSKSAENPTANPEAAEALRRARRASAITTIALFLLILAGATLWVAYLAPGVAGLIWAVIATAIGAALTLWIHDARETTIDATFGVRER